MDHDYAYLDPPARAIFRMICAGGFVVTLSREGPEFVAAATNGSGQRWACRGGDLYTVARRLAGLVDGPSAS